MAQKVVGFVKLQIPAGKATPAPPVGPALFLYKLNLFRNYSVPFIVTLFLLTLF